MTSLTRAWLLPDGRVAVPAALPGCWLLIDAAGRMGIAHGELADDAAEMHPLPSPAPPPRAQVPAPTLPPGEDDAEVWLPQLTDDVTIRPEHECPHCTSVLWHARTRRCGMCGRRPGPSA
jgi:hypothetical protein